MSPSRRMRRKLQRTAHGMAELARREKRDEEKARRIIAERERLGLTEEKYNALPPAAKNHILALEERLRRTG
jgi:hypothetical protein